MKKFLSTTLSVVALLAGKQAGAYEPYSSSITLQGGVEAGLMSVLNVNAGGRSFCFEPLNYNIQARYFITDHWGAFIREDFLSTGDKSSLVFGTGDGKYTYPSNPENLTDFKCNSTILGVAYRQDAGIWSLLGGIGAGIATPTDYSMTYRLASGSQIPDVVRSVNLSSNMFVLSGQIEAECHFSDYIYAFTNLSLLGIPRKYPILNQIFATEETFASKVQYGLGMIEEPVYQPGELLEQEQSKSNCGLITTLSLGIGITLGK